MNETITTPFKTATPDNAMNPTPAEMESGRSRSHNAAIPPVSASGTPLKTSAASLAEPKVSSNRPKISTMVSGTSNCRRAEADCNCSKVPPYSSQ